MSDLDPRGDLMHLLGLQETTAEHLVSTASVVAEHGGEVDQLREIIAGHGRIGEVMLKNVQKTKMKYEAASPVEDEPPPPTPIPPSEWGDSELRPRGPREPRPRGLLQDGGD